MAATEMSRDVAADVIDQVHTHHDMALKAAGRRIVEGHNAADTTSVAFEAYKSSWRDSLVYLNQRHGKHAISSALKVLGLSHLGM